MCGRSLGSEAAIHAMRQMFANKNTDAVILVDAANAFNNLNRNVLLHNIKYACPEISTCSTRNGCLCTGDNTNDEYLADGNR